jgi:hypothetical protein
LARTANKMDTSRSPNEVTGVAGRLRSAVRCALVVVGISAALTNVAAVGASARQPSPGPDQAAQSACFLAHNLLSNTPQGHALSSYRDLVSALHASKTRGAAALVKQADASPDKTKRTTVLNNVQTWCSTLGFQCGNAACVLNGLQP